MIKDFEQLSLNLSQGHPLYDKIVPKNHPLRLIEEQIDFSFVTPLLSDRYSIDYGRPAYSPEVMFKLLFLKMLYNLSDERVIQEAQVNMAYKYFLNLDPEDPLMHPSSLTKFRKLRLNQEDILEDLLGEVINQAIQKNLIPSKTLIMDATHTRSRYKVKTPIENLREVSKNIRKQLYRYVPEVKDHVPPKLHSTASLEEEVIYTQELIEFSHRYQDKNRPIQEAREKALDILKNRTYQAILSVSDPEAKMGYKSKTEAFAGYKTHLAITEERLMTAIEVTTGEANDGKYLKTLVEKSKKNGIEVKEVLADAAYSSKENLGYMEQENITAVTPLNPIVLNGGKREVEGFEYNKDAGQMRCPAGHLSVRKARTGKKNQKKNQSLTYYFEIEKCKHCPLRDGCYKPGAKSKTYSMTLKSDIHQKAIDYQKTNEFKDRKKQRYKIEAKNAELKQSHGFQTCKFARLFGMKIQAYLTAFVVNTKRIVKLVTEKQAIFQIGLLDLIQKMDMIENKEKGAYYFINNKLLFQWPLKSIEVFYMEAKG